FLTSSVAGVTHALFSLYWFMGGSLLTDTVSAQLALLADRHWLLLTVAVVKTGFALLPLVLLARRYQRRRPVRVVCWFGATVLLLWGGVNTVTSNLVLAGFIQPSDDYDRLGMAGHAWLWDPLFLLWGGALIIGLMCSRGRAVVTLGSADSRTAAR